MRESKRRNSKYFPIHTLPSSHLPKTHGLSPSGDSQKLGSCGNACLIATSSHSPTAPWDGDSMTEAVLEKQGKHGQLSEAEKSNNKSQIFTMRAKRVGAQLLWACAGGWGFSLALLPALGSATRCLCGHNHWTLLHLRGVRCSNQPVGQSMCIPWACLLHSKSPPSMWLLTLSVTGMPR